MTTRFLVVEDDPDIRNLVITGLRDEGHDADASESGEEAVELIERNTYDAVILDLMLPAMSGLDVLREIRGRGVSCPVLILTARDAIAEKVAVLDAGADDYMTKPFAFSELAARMRALFRRAHGAASAVIQIADLMIDPVFRKVSRAGEAVDLTTREFALLHFLALNEGKPVTRRAIALEVWEDDHESFSNVIDVHINRLRNKIGRACSGPLIHTVRGVGYMLGIDAS